MRIAFNVIHPSEAVERQPYAQQSIDLLTSSGIENLNVPAVYTPTMSEVETFLATNPNIRFNQHEVFGDLFPGRAGLIGCFASHYSIWLKMYETKHDAVIVIEDDACLTKDFVSILNCLLLMMPENWDFFSLYVPPDQYHYYQEWKHKTPIPSICKRYQTWSTAAYVVSRKGAMLAIRDILNFGVSLPIDWYIYDRGPGLFENYCPAPHIPPIVTDSPACANSVDGGGRPISFQPKKTGSN